MFQFRQHTYEPATGEIEGPGGSARLQPKPARLLVMLLEAGGELVEREDIRAALWPDTNVDFDAGLNTCVRQIRTALGDTGGEPAWIETLPKRGYRVAVGVSGTGAVESGSPAATPGPEAPAGTAHPEAPAVAAGSEAATETAGSEAPAATAGADAGLTRQVAPYVAVLLVLAIGTAAVMWNELFIAAAPAEQVTGSANDAAVANGAGAAIVAPVRLAMLPFVDPEQDDPGSFNRSLTEAYLTALVAAAPQQLVVVGPTTTTTLQQQAATLPQIAAATDTDFVLHGGRRASDSVFFVEVVHPDGAHLFARRFEVAAESPAEPPPGLIEDLTAAILDARSR